MAKSVELREETPQAAGRTAAGPIIDIPAGRHREFRAGWTLSDAGGLKAPLKEGDSFLITLHFDKAGTAKRGGEDTWHSGDGHAACGIGAAGRHDGERLAR